MLIPRITVLGMPSSTRKLYNGTTEWIPPPHLGHGQPHTNNYHHPQRYLTNTNRRGV
jgi:hypothetical protein